MKHFLWSLSILMLLMPNFTKLQASKNFEFLRCDEVVNATVDDAEIRSYAEVRNISGLAIQMKIKFEIIEFTEGYEYTMCDPISCYANQTSDFVTTHTFTLYQDYTTSTVNPRKEYYLDVLPFGKPGKAIIKVKFFNIVDEEDFIEYIATFNIGVSSVIDLNEIIAIFPNPASDFLNIDIGFDYWVNPNLEIYDVTGNLILNSMLRNSKNTINISKLSEGTYYYIIRDLGRKKRTGRFLRL